MTGGANFILFLTGLVLTGATAWALLRLRDPLHPLIILCPLLFWAYVWTPFVGIMEESVVALVPMEQLPTVLWVNLLFIAAFCLGCAWLSAAEIGRRSTVPLASYYEFIASQRRQIFQFVLILTLYAQIGYWSGIIKAGGFAAAFSQSKGGGWFSSGYLGDASLAAYPALLLFAVTRIGRRISFQDICIGILIVLPNLIQGTFGGRRGPMFISIMSLGIAYCQRRFEMYLIPPV